MRVDVFPSVYQEMIDSQMNDAIFREQSRSEDAISAIRKATAEKPDISGSIFGFGIVGFGIGFFNCVCQVMKGNETLGLALVPVLTIVGAFLGWRLSSAASSSYRGSVTSAEQQIASEKRRSEEIIQNLRRDAGRKREQYAREFESEAKRLSAVFAESKLANDVVYWMVYGFSSAIDAADRRPHIENISVPFVFKVYTAHP